MEPVAAFALLLGMFAVTTTSDTLSAVLLGVPGPAGAATLMDGHPLAKRGEAMRALGAAYTSSAIGGVLGAMVGAASLPILKPIVLTFGPPEFFMLGVLGLTFVGALSGGSMLKGAAPRCSGSSSPPSAIRPRAGSPATASRSTTCSTASRSCRWCSACSRSPS